MFDSQFTLDGYTFGGVDDDVIVLEDGLDTGSAEIRDQDADMPRGDGSLFGRDTLGSPTWSFTLGVRSDAADVYEKLAALANVWRADHNRNSPGAVSTLAFSRNGREQVVFGRPRRFAVVPAKFADPEFQTVEAQFKLLDPFIYSGEEQSLRMGLIETASTGGLVLPETLPWSLAANQGTRKGIVTVGGFTATPLKVRIYGPTVQSTLTNVQITAPGFTLKLNTTIAPNQMVEVDTRTRTVMSDGISLAGHLSADSRLGTKLLPGSTEFTFYGEDSSYTSQAEFLWRDAEYSV